MSVAVCVAVVGCFSVILLVTVNDCVSVTVCVAVVDSISVVVSVAVTDSVSVVVFVVVEDSTSVRVSVAASVTGPALDELLQEQVQLLRCPGQLFSTSHQHTPGHIRGVCAKQRKPQKI